jgi:membrane-bound lytic murein transglycosylase MltF
MNFLKTILILLSLSSFSSLAVEGLGEHIKTKRKGGLNKILKDRYFRVLTSKNVFDYYVYQGKSKGIQLEMIKLFTEQLNRKYSKNRKQLKIAFEIIPVDYDQLIPMLQKGQGDIIATGLTATKKRKKLVSFSIPYRKVDEVVVTRKENVSKGWANQKYSVRKSSSYYESLLKKKKVITIDTVSEELHDEVIMDLVSHGLYEYTISDSYLAELAVKAFSNLEILEERPFGREVEISWAVRKEDKKLLREINTFIPKVRKGSLLGNMFDRKYFKDMAQIRTSDFDRKTSKISKYDKLFKKYAKIYDFDWRLLAALCYQESRFNPRAHNRWGAIGLMQIKQSTANDKSVRISNIKGMKNIENNIHAGVKYLSWLKKTYFDKNTLIDEKDRVRLALAAYNAGPGRVQQAIRHAKKKKRNSNKWFREVEISMLEMGYPEPIGYVTEINKRYVSYLLLGIK